jgi:hypothetical protein
MRKLFGPSGDKVQGNRRKLHEGELHDLYASPNIIQVMETRRMRWVGHAARMGIRKIRIGSWWGNAREARWMATGTWGSNYRQYLMTVCCCDYIAPVIEYEYGIEISLDVPDFGLS